MVLPPSPPLVDADVDAVLAGVADLMQGNVSATRFCSRPCARRYLNARQGSVSRAVKAMRYGVFFWFFMEEDDEEEEGKKREN